MYRSAPDYIKRQINQAFTDRISVGADGNVKVKMAEPYNILLIHSGEDEEPQYLETSRINRLFSRISSFLTQK